MIPGFARLSPRDIRFVERFQGVAASDDNIGRGIKRRIDPSVAADFVKVFAYQGHREIVCVRRAITVENSFLKSSGRYQQSLDSLLNLRDRGGGLFDLAV